MKPSNSGRKALEIPSHSRLVDALNGTTGSRPKRVREAASLFNVSKVTLHKWMKIRNVERIDFYQ